MKSRSLVPPGYNSKDNMCHKCGLRKDIKTYQPNNSVSMIRRNRILKDSLKPEILKRPYTNDNNSTVLERVGFPQRKEKHKKNLARITFYVKKKFERQLKEQDQVFSDYINKTRSKSTSQLKKAKFKISTLSPSEDMDDYNYADEN